MKISQQSFNGSRKPVAANRPVRVAVESPFICFSHLRWDFVFQRPQHLLTRAAKRHPVFFIEEPIQACEEVSSVSIRQTEWGVTVITPCLNQSDRQKAPWVIQDMVSQVIPDETKSQSIFWYYTPMALEISSEWPRALTVYDCMDDLSGFDGADPRLVEFERRLLRQADIVFTGGQSLYEAKKKLHRAVHCMPSSIDQDHFGRSKFAEKEPADQAAIKGFKIGFFGVLDERLDRELVREVSRLRPEWHFIFLGPVVKIDPAVLPKAPNIHYLGQKNYSSLPDYLGFWDVAMLPFALNRATRFISPTKTPEYLAGGKPVVSTPINDVVSPYGKLGLVQIAATPEEFVQSILTACSRAKEVSWLQTVTRCLSSMSWERTWAEMSALIYKELASRTDYLSEGRTESRTETSSTLEI